MFDAIGIAGTGLTVHRKWLDAVSDNLANANTARSTDDEAFRAQYVLARAGDAPPGRPRRRSSTPPPSR